ncbi:hypothetical protein V4F39_27135 [Aquincola sp. MAHUQ-54]|uniref:Uncharacterized protein n=1 Tax=Aquincola agrisoli TaxID=3119538 RepID=A0AAW9QQD9_9BURK
MNHDEHVQHIEDVYRQLVKGVGRERVTEANAPALIRRSEQDGHHVLAEELREWLNPAKPGRPATGAPTRGFNKDNAKH